MWYIQELLKKAGDWIPSTELVAANNHRRTPTVIGHEDLVALHSELPEMSDDGDDGRRGDGSEMNASAAGFVWRFESIVGIKLFRSSYRR
jgi:hypothetical protein